MRIVRDLDARMAGQRLHRAGGELRFTGVLIGKTTAIGILRSKVRVRPVKMRHRGKSQ